MGRDMEAEKEKKTVVPELLVKEGPLAGKRFSVGDAGLRLGRSSSCEIAIADPALSRNQCLFELRDGVVWVTDLASANGTSVNGEELGTDSKALQVGDSVQAGGSVLQVVYPEGAEAAVDLGFSAGGSSGGSEASRRTSVVRLILWLVVVLTLAGSTVAVLLAPREAAEAPEAAATRAVETPRLSFVEYEKVVASTDGILRYALAFDAKGVMSVELDDVPVNDRHVRKSQPLTPDAREQLERIFSASAIYRLDREYSGVAPRPGELKSWRVKIIRGSSVFTTSVENTQPPEALKDVLTRLETFSKNELGIWAISYSADDLVAMSGESERSADAKWDERDVAYGNRFLALKSYEEAIFYLDTVNPKPDNFDALLEKRDKARAELENYYKERRFEADRAINLSDWPTAKQALRVLCDAIPDSKDSRYQEASAKLLDVEARLKEKGRGKKGGR